MAKSSSKRDAAARTAARTAPQAQAVKRPAKSPPAKAARSRIATGTPAPQAQGTPRAAGKAQSPRQAPRTPAAAKPAPRPQAIAKPMPTAHAAVKPALKGVVGTPAPAPAAAAPDIPARHAGLGAEREGEKEAGPAKQPVDDKQHPYARGRLSTPAGLRHVAVHLVTGLAGGLLINKLFDKKPAEKKRQAPEEKAEIKEKDGAKKNMETSSPPSPRQQQELRIAHATAQPVKAKARGRTR